MEEIGTTSQPQPTSDQPAHNVPRYILLSIAFIASLIGLYFVLPRVQRPAWINVARTLVILVGTILPVALYDYFSQGRLPIFYKEYKQNLRRLGFWENAQQYKDKFTAIYGPATRQASIRRTLNSPILITTLLTFLGWLLVFYPAPPDAEHFVPNQVPVAFGFLGAYIFGLASLVRQYVTDDLQPRYYASLATRYLTVLVLAWIITLILPDTAGDAATNNALIATFFIGLFPTIGLRVVQRAATSILGRAYQGFKEPQPLSHLDGLNAYHEDRLLLEGIENQQSLASASIIELMLKTRFPVEQIIDWIDQALLYIHTRERYQQFRSSGLRTATDFLDTYDAYPGDPERQRVWRLELARLLDSQPATPSSPAGAGTPANSTTVTLLEAIARALRPDPNLFHVRHWRDNQFEALPEDIEAERTLADMKLMQDLPEEAIAAYDDLLRRYPNYVATLLYRGLAYARAGDHDTAIVDYSEAIKRASQSPGWRGIRYAYVYRGRARLALRQYEKAAADFRDALALDADFAEARMELAVAQATYLSEYDAAIGNFDTVIQQQFNVPEALANRGLARYERWKQQDRRDDRHEEELEAARQDLEQALRRKPGLVTCYVNLALVLGQLNELAKKEEILTRALTYLEAEPDPTHAYRVRLERGYLFLYRGDLQRAREDFRRATQLAPDRPTAYYFLGTTFEQMERAPDAEDAFSMALRLAQQADDRADQAQAHLGLGRLYRKLSRPGEAHRHLHRALELAADADDDTADDTYTRVTHELGLLARDQGERAQAVKHFSVSAALFAVLQQTRASIEAYLHLGRTQLALGNAAQAERALEAAHAKLPELRGPEQKYEADLHQQIEAARADLYSDETGAEPVATEAATGDENAGGAKGAGGNDAAPAGT